MLYSMKNRRFTVFLPLLLLTTACGQGATSTSHSSALKSDALPDLSDLALPEPDSALVTKAERHGQSSAVQAEHEAITLKRLIELLREGPAQRIPPEAMKPVDDSATVENDAEQIESVSTESAATEPVQPLVEN